MYAGDVITGLEPQQTVPRCGSQSSLVTPSCHQILLCGGSGEQRGGDWRGGAEVVVVAVGGVGGRTGGVESGLMYRLAGGKGEF